MMAEVSMKRKIYEQLKEWKTTSNGTTALLIEGARRVGKSYIVEEFARNEYESYILVDFNRAGQQVRSLFDNLDDLDTFFLFLSAYYNIHLTERNSLIIFDEVQLFPRARAAIKFLVADGRYDYIETGSLVSIRENVKDILIPSEEHHLRMNPMDFEEFLEALGEEQMIPLIRTCFRDRRPLGQALHRKAMNLFRQYLIVGGMPQAVQEYIDTRDFSRVDAKKRDIISLYEDDIGKHAQNLQTKVRNVFDEVPSQLMKHDRKFRLSAISSSARYREYEDALFWLNDANIVNLCFNTTEPSIGLRMNEDRTTLKCYLLDTGLLVTMSFDENTIVSQQIYKKILFDKLEVNLGMLMENVTAQMLTAAGHRLYFYNNPDRYDSSSRMEIDFLIAKKDITNRHNICPIEVKSSTRFTTISLNKCVRKYSQQIDIPYIIYTGDIKEEEGIRYIPLYMAGLL